MITIRCNPYTDAEVHMLFKILRTAEHVFLSEYCRENCESCKYKHVCYDLEKARSYMRNIKEMIEL